MQKRQLIMNQRFKFFKCKDERHFVEDEKALFAETG